LDGFKPLAGIIIGEFKLLLVFSTIKSNFNLQVAVFIPKRWQDPIGQCFPRLLLALLSVVDARD
jgi:hypothetical protein